jgi:hypothetical protein
MREQPPSQEMTIVPYGYCAIVSDRVVGHPELGERTRLIGAGKSFPSMLLTQTEYVSCDRIKSVPLFDSNLTGPFATYKKISMKEAKLYASEDSVVQSLYMTAVRSELIKKFDFVLVLERLGIELPLLYELVVRLNDSMAKLTWGGIQTTLSKITRQRFSPENIRDISTIISGYFLSDIHTTALQDAIADAARTHAVIYQY